MPSPPAKPPLSWSSGISRIELHSGATEKQKKKKHNGATFDADNWKWIKKPPAQTLSLSPEPEPISTLTSTINRRD
ncbi:hypothetical protein CSHISOI_01283 [Colletotrichum shisoi]|uniref:Uncharacterized protein n=1 Tax=Colletotrichum shisoi TaxID=2078593 RepID=A0A5Q4C492_9PEZI|nr:hypothetical protein CSHISOI_01283 [Colletotrichum shisoi]